MQFESPRLRGIREHLDRAQFFFNLAEKEKDPKANYRLMLAAVYSCRNHRTDAGGCRARRGKESERSQSQGKSGYF